LNIIVLGDAPELD